MIYKEQNDEQFEIEYGGYMRLVDAIILHIYDLVAISGKWLKKDIGLKTLLTKKAILKEMNNWLRSDNWDALLGIYCEYNGYYKKTINKKMENIRKKSVSRVNKLIHEKEKEIESSKTGV